MITPFPPPPGPRVELLRVRQVDPTVPVERSAWLPLRDPGDVALTTTRQVDRVEISDEALRLLALDLQQHQSGEKP